ncbi:innexin inx2-like [Homalodisca vitripennis]|uniref:innexin inx2-like n=1 Tax=Homalodisca vitripennis TaxID=197043 RepID=UPI001EEC3A4F|nr:innexin inx2-like [Homalodisca vitripennis]
MGDILGNVLQTLLPGDHIIIDDLIFRLHYQTTTCILIACLAIIIGTRSLDDVFACFKEDNTRIRSIEPVCYAQNTFTAMKNMSHVMMDIKTPVTVHSHHDWVLVLLSIQVFIFIAPRYIWKLLESGRMESLVSYIRRPNLSDTDKNLWKQEKVNYFTSERHQPPSLYVYAYIVCEILNLVNDLLQISLMDHFLGAVFSTHGWDILSLISTPSEDRVDALALVFPTLGLCTLRDLGSWMCHLRFNYMSENTFVLLWFWYAFLAYVSIINLTQHAPALLSREIRAQYLQELMLDDSRSEEARVVAHSFNLSEWFMLCRIGENIDTIIFQQLVVDIDRQIHSL